MNSKRLLSVNVYYSPQSFGGATIVAEEINKILSRDYIWDVLVFCTFQSQDYLPYHTMRYNTKGVTVISVNLPNSLNYKEFYRNEKIGSIFRSLVSAFRPDVAHIHSVQMVGSSILSILKEESDVTTYLTIHDCWWICERQFMINQTGKYCFQKQIDPMVCMYCVDEQERYEVRQRYISSQLEHVDYYLFPSDFHRELHIANGFDKEKCLTNKNGVRLPDTTYRKIPSETVRFGFTGGPGKIKGYDLIIKAFEEIELNNYELVVVDAARNVGKSWSHAFKNTKIKGKIRILPPYTQDTMDSYYKHIDILLFPSQWKESFGLTVREALVRNIWIISTNGGGTTEDLVEGENANIIPISNNVSYLKNAIFKCMDKNWSKYENPYADDIITYQKQAEQLYQIFSQKEIL